MGVINRKVLALAAGHQEEYYEVKDQRYLGDENFVEAVSRSIDEQEPVSPVKITMEEIVRELARETGMTIRGLLGKGRGRVESRLRVETAYVGREVGGIRLTEVIWDGIRARCHWRSSDWRRRLQRTGVGRWRWSGSAPGFAGDEDVITK
jgi:hypothetical protein